MAVADDRIYMYTNDYKQIHVTNTECWNQHVHVHANYATSVPYIKSYIKKTCIKRTVFKEC